MILAGDVGGTKTVLALYEKRPGESAECIREQTFLSQEFREFDDVLDSFLTAGCRIESACFGIAGPIVEQRCRMTNLAWSIEADKLKIKLGTSKVKLLNDLEAMAVGMLYLPEHDLIELNSEAVTQPGTIAVIAAGTGLGEAILYWDGTGHHPMATEGGHCDFAPQDEQQDKLLRFMRKRYPGHVSCERILSGIGFSHLYDFLCEDGFAPPSPVVEQIGPDSGVDRNAVISKLGVEGEDPLCREVLRLFVYLYGAETGNLFLKSLAMGGIFIGGGIAPKILSAMKSEDFMTGFCAKGRYADLMNKISIKLALNPRTPLIGAAHYFG